MKKVTTTYTCDICEYPYKTKELISVCQDPGFQPTVFSYDVKTETADKHVCYRCVEKIKNTPSFKK